MKRLIILIVMYVFLHVNFAHSEEKKTLTFGIVPQQAAAKLAKQWGPILKKISEQSGITLRFATAPNIPEFEKRLKKGLYDIAYMNPYHYVVFQESNGYKAIAKAKDKRIKGIIVTTKDSPYRTLGDLNGLTISFPSPNAFAASILPRASLQKKNISFSKKYVSSHDSVYRAVAKDIFAAGGGVKRTFNAMAPTVRDKLRILWTSKGYTPHAIAVHPRVSFDESSAIQKALTSPTNSSERNNLFSPLKINGFINANDKDWDDVRKLNIKEDK